MAKIGWIRARGLCGQSCWNGKFLRVNEMEEDSSKRPLVYQTNIDSGDIASRRSSLTP